jgi:hypothetical protein
MYRITWYAGMCGINSHMLTIYTLYYGQMCVLCRGFRSNGFITKVQPFPMDSYYRADIISDVGHPRSNAVMPPVLCTIAYNGWGTDIIL